MKTQTAFIFLAGLSGLVACGKAPAPGTEPAATKAPEATATETQEKINPAILMSIAPDPVDFCTSKLAVVTVTWDSNAAPISSYTIWVEAPGIPRKTWVSSVKRAASKDTGMWVREKTKFSMTDTTGTTVASATVSSKLCAAPSANGTTPQ